jgi:hypothetical protein
MVVKVLMTRRQVLVERECSRMIETRGLRELPAMGIDIYCNQHAHAKRIKLW